MRFWWQSNSKFRCWRILCCHLNFGGGGRYIKNCQSVNQLNLENRTHERSWILEERIWMGDEVNLLSPILLLVSQWVYRCFPAAPVGDWFCNCLQAKAVSSLLTMIYLICKWRHKMELTDKTQDQFQVRVTVGDKQWSNSWIRLLFRLPLSKLNIY